ncbi:MAG: MBOAT family protein [Erysipelotrichaceae bacterium]|nr:MBOAT family protein [Erysipelotrichaceae bacterium]
MTFLSLEFYLLVLVTMVLYYLIPLKLRWFVLLVGSMAFYYLATGMMIIALIVTIVVSYLFSIVIYTGRRKFSDTVQKVLLGVFIVITLLPLILVKQNGILIDTSSWVAPLGLAFYSLQIVAYFVDIYKGKIKPKRNILKYALFISFFPQIIQGPIPRYDQLNKTLYGNRMDPEKINAGFVRILWGWFLKLVIADKAAIVVNTVFNDPVRFKGAFIFAAGMLYCIQLYADFSGCVSISQGVAGLFGVELAENFRRPFFSRTIKEFWTRWHMSLSSWLRDYIYFPLGGSRKGQLRRFLNLIITFAVSGVWHGNGLNYLVWGLLNAFYQIIGDITGPWREKLCGLVGIDKDCIGRVMVQRVITTLLFMVSVIFLRSDSLAHGIELIVSMFSVYNPWVLFNGNLLSLGMDGMDFVVLLVAIMIWIIVSYLQEKEIVIRDVIARQPFMFRWVVYLSLIVIVMVFGTYGFGFNAEEFIYGGF